MRLTAPLVVIWMSPPSHGADELVLGQAVVVHGAFGHGPCEYCGSRHVGGPGTVLKGATTLSDASEAIVTRMRGPDPTVKVRSIRLDEGVCKD